MPKLRTDEHIPAGVSPNGQRIPAGAYFQASTRWLDGRRNSPILEVVTIDRYWEATLDGQSVTHDPEDVPDRYVDQQTRQVDESTVQQVAQRTGYNAVTVRSALEGDFEEVREPIEDAYRQVVGSQETAPEIDSAAAAREHVADHEAGLREALPDELPDAGEASSTERILYAVLEGGYNERRQVLADLEGVDATGDDEQLERKLYRRLYELELEE